MGLISILYVYVVNSKFFSEIDPKVLLEINAKFRLE